MDYGLRNLQVEEACGDIRTRSLANLRGEFAKLIYLASTRDYASGRYSHDGLAMRFGADVAAKALEQCHKECFVRLVSFSLEKIVEELRVYIATSGADAGEVIHTWESLQPYRVTTPVECDPLAAELFISNVKIALAIVRSHDLLQLPDPQSASLHP